MTAPMALHVQHYDVWAGAGDDNVTVFADVDGEWFQAFAFVGSKERCLQICRWTTTPSETGGCLDLTLPRRLADAIPLLDQECPTLTLQDALDSRGWPPEARKVLHDSVIHPWVRQPYDCRNLIQNRFYLQCCIHWDQVAEAVPSTMPSAQPQLYYRLLLAGKSVEPGMGNDHYKLCWKDEGEPKPLEDQGSDEEYKALHAPMPPPPQAPLPLPPPPPTPGLFMARHSGAKRAGGDSPPTPVPLPPSGVPPVDDVVDPVAVSEPPPPPPGPFLARPKPLRFSYTLADGSRIRRDHYVQPGGGLYKNWVMTCKIPGHTNCKKPRSVKFNKTSGRIEPPAWLHVWLAEGLKPGIDTQQKHNAAHVDPVSVAEWVRTNGDRFLLDSALDLDAFSE